MSNDLLFERPTGISEGPAEFFISFVDTLTGGAWGTVLILLAFGLVYFNLNQFNPRKAFAAGSFSAMVTTVMLVPLGVAGDQHFIAAVFAVILAVIINRGVN